eukprot:Lithocolla_globosa_v1_NODE_5448_length_1237_cov_33.906937.p2 type:complete len:131 gc:universal NODE_5448_length_1237_cov_33.906937:334-726(+)
MKRNGIDVGVMTEKGLNGVFAGTDIPETGSSVTACRHKGLFGLTVGFHRQTHHITGVPLKGVGSKPVFNVPQNAGHVTRTGQDLRVGQKSAARKVASVATELSGNPGTTALPQVVDGTHIIKTTAGNKVT